MSFCARGLPVLAVEPEAELQCTLCGCRFVHGGRVCSACPIARGCDLVRCPNCGYQFPRTSRLADAVRRLWRSVRRTA